MKAITTIALASAVLAPNAAPAVHIYVVDTGVRITHRDFSQRADRAANFCAGTPDDDVDGHGTHTASIAAGVAAGVAPTARVHALKAFGPGCAGASPVLSALDWIVEQAQRPAVVNYSGGSFSDDRVRMKVLAVARAGFPIAVSAACVSDTATVWGVAALRQSEGVFIAGSVDDKNRAPDRVSYGPALTLFAPAIGITAANHTSDTARSVYPPQANPACADSFAAPRVAGAIATYLELHPAATPPEVYSALITSASPWWVGGVRNRNGAPDRVLRIRRQAR